MAEHALGYVAEFFESGKVAGLFNLFSVGIFARDVSGFYFWFALKNLKVC